MSHAYSRNFVHVVFSTKERHEWIRDDRAVWSLLGDSVRSYGAEPIEIGGTRDHVHALIQVPPKISVVTLVRAMKANSSKSINDAGHLFAWQQGYGCFSVSASNLERVRSYIQKQGEHHRKHSFEDEFKALLEKHGITFSKERFLG
jgi:REP element-mobilizing transposase RayT